MKVADTGVPPEELIGAVKAAVKLAAISQADQDRDLRVASIQLILHTVASAGGGAGVNFRVPFLGMELKVGGAVTHGDTHTIDVILQPPPAEQIHEVREGEVEAALVNAVETIRGVVASAAGGDDPFELKAASVEVSFAVTREGHIVFGGNGELRNEVRHTLRIGLARSR